MTQIQIQCLTLGESHSFIFTEKKWKVSNDPYKLYRPEVFFGQFVRSCKDSLTNLNCLFLLCNALRNSVPVENLLIAFYWCEISIYYFIHYLRWGQKLFMLMEDFIYFPCKHKVYDTLMSCVITNKNHAVNADHLNSLNWRRAAEHVCGPSRDWPDRYKWHGFWLWATVKLFNEVPDFGGGLRFRSSWGREYFWEFFVFGRRGTGAFHCRRWDGQRITLLLDFTRCMKFYFLTIMFGWRGWRRWRWWQVWMWWWWGVFSLPRGAGAGRPSFLVSGSVWRALRTEVVKVSQCLHTHTHTHSGL